MPAEFLPRVVMVFPETVFPEPDERSMPSEDWFRVFMVLLEKVLDWIEKAKMPEE